MSGGSSEYPLEKVEDITWVPKEKIQEAARLFATTKPAAIQWGVAIEQQVNCADNNRALLALMGITGNIDVQGGQVLFSSPKIRNVGQFGAHKMLSRNRLKNGWEVIVSDWREILPSSIPNASGMPFWKKSPIPLKCSFSSAPTRS